MKNGKETEKSPAPHPTSIRCKTHEAKQAVLDVHKCVQAHPESASAISNFVRTLQEESAKGTSYGDMAEIFLRIANLEQKVEDLTVKLEESVSSSSGGQQEAVRTGARLHEDLVPQGRPRKRHEHLTDQQKDKVRSMIEEGKDDLYIRKVFNLSGPGVRYYKKPKLENNRSQENDEAYKPPLIQAITDNDEVEALLKEAKMKPRAIRKHLEFIENKAPHPNDDHDHVAAQDILKKSESSCSKHIVEEVLNHGNEISEKTTLECETFTQPKRGLTWEKRLMMAYMLRSWEGERKYTLSDIANHFGITRDAVKKYHLRRIKNAGILESDEKIELRDIVRAYSLAPGVSSPADFEDR